MGALEVHDLETSKVTEDADVTFKHKLCRPWLLSPAATAQKLSSFEESTDTRFVLQAMPAGSILQFKF